MKKTICLFMLLFLAASVNAQLLIGGKAGGMGGAGVANVTDISSVYYNPAAFMQAGSGLKLSAGASYSDATALTNALSKSNDPAQFMVDNYANSFNFNAGIDGILGLNLKGLGISILPIAAASVKKTASSVQGTVEVDGKYAAALTLGRSFDTSFLPARLDVGLNLKAITAYRGNITATGTATNAAGTRVYQTGSGMGADLGLLTTFDLPYVANFKAGVTARNLAQTINYTGDSQPSTLVFYPTSPTTGTGEVVAGPKTTLTSTETTTPSYAIGASATIPALKLNVAGDVEMAGSDTNLHLGIEYPLLANIVILRGGIASGPNLAKTTYGLMLNLPILKLDIVSVADAKNSANTSYIADINLFTW